MKNRVAKKLMPIVITIIMVVTLLPIFATPALAADTWDGSADTDWYTTNTSATSYEIDTAEELAGLASLVNANTQTFSGRTINLTADLDLSGTNWTSIGASNYFNGTFDGCGHKISNLTRGTASVPDGTSSFSGLFGSVASATLKNVYLKDASIYLSAASMRVGCLAANVSSGCTISNCGSSGSIVCSDTSASNQRVGGLIGCAAQLTISNCYSTANCTGNATGNYAKIGGLIGDAQTSINISNCYAAGNVTSGNAYVGGVIGYYPSTNTTSSYVYWNSDATHTINTTQVLLTENKKAVGSSQTISNESKAASDMKLSTFADALNAQRGSNAAWAIVSGENGGYPTFAPPNAAPVASAVSISGTATYGQELTGSYTYTDADSDAQGTSTFKWYRADDASGTNKAPISGATATTYTLVAADVDKYICFEVTPKAATGTSPGTAATSSYTAQVQRLDCATATGITPVLSSKTDTSVTLTSVTGYEYLRVADDAEATGTWQDSNVFSGLSANTAYDFYQRVKQTATHKASGISEKLDVSTFDTPAVVSWVEVPYGTYMAGENLYFAVNFDKIVNVNETGGTPRIALTIGSTMVYANYYIGSGSPVLTFRYTIESGLLDGDGITMGALTLNGGTIQDATGNNADLTLNSVGSTKTVHIDAVAPTISSIGNPANGTYKAGENLDFTVNFSEAVTAYTFGGTPHIDITIGSTVVKASCANVAGTSAVVFRYTVEEGLFDGDGITVGSSVSLNGGTIKDAAGNNATLTFTGGTLPGVLVKKTQTISFANPGAKDFGTSPTLTASSSSGLTVTFTSDTMDVCTVTSGGALTFLKAGDATISAAQAGNDEYLPATTVPQTFKVNAVAPGAPSIGTATAGDNEATVTFTAPSSNGGAAISGYTVTASPGGATGTGAGSPITVMGLTNGVAYTFTVTATNSEALTSSASAASNSVTPRASQTITFTDPGDQNFGTSPTLTADSTSGLTVSFTSDTPDVCTITSLGTLTFLKAGEAKISANQAGNASFLPATTVTRTFNVNAVAPGAPTSVAATRGDGQASISFTPPSFTGGADITGYTVTSNPGGLTGTGTGSPITVSGLTNGVAYTFTVTATNDESLTSSASAASNSVTPAPVPTVTGLSPAYGTLTGGTSVIITGTYFTGATAVNFGSTAATSYTVDSSTQITATSPAHSIGNVYVTVTTPGGTSATGAASQFTFADITAPILSAQSASAVTSSGATLNVTSNEEGTYYYLVYAAADSAPNAATVKAQGTAAAKGTGAATASANAIIVTGLSGTTAYKAYVIVADAANNLSAVSPISFTTKTKLSAPTGLAWDSAVPGKAKWNAVTNASSYSVRLYKDGNAKGSAINVAAGTLYYDFTTAITTLGTGTYTFEMMAKGDGLSFENSNVSAQSSGYSYTAPSPTPSPTPTPAPTPTPTPTPKPTVTPKPTATPEPTATPTPVPTMTPAPTATPSPSATPGESVAPTPSPSATSSETADNTRTITGTLLDANGNPMAGYVVELHSDPITTVTDANGRYAFYDVDYTSHDLIVKTPEGEQIAEFALAFSEGEEFNTDMTDKGVNITYTRSTATVTIDVALEADNTGAAIEKVEGSDIPQTTVSLNSGGSALLWIGIGAAGALLIAVLIIFLAKRKKNGEDVQY